MKDRERGGRIGKKSILTLVVPVPVNDVIRHSAELVLSSAGKHVLSYVVLVCVMWK